MRKEKQNKQFVLRWYGRDFENESYYNFDESRDYTWTSLDKATKFDQLSDLLEAVAGKPGYGYCETEIVEVHEVNNPTYERGAKIL